MPIEALSKKDLEEKAPASRVHPEYVSFLTSARLGTGGRLYVAKEGVSRQSVKNRLKAAAVVTGKNIKFLRSPSEQVVFQIVE
ncbi:MAG: hypothetical protein H6648_06150 [Caldilineae bacterium]|nr:hypothetical protein [Caldilineae bacterium]